MTYESNRNLVDVVENKYDTTTISKFDYTNDAVGRRTARQDTGSAFTLTQANTFKYNLRSEVTEAMMSNGQSEYVFDPIGNRIEATLPEEQVPLVYAANERNQYTSITGRTIPVQDAYDDDGNMLVDGAGLAMKWDEENRLIETVKDGQTVTYTYDYMSRRVRKTVGNVTHEYLYDGWNLLRETIDDQQSKIENYYAWGLDLSQSLQGAGGVGGLLLVSGLGGVHAPTFDANGNISEYIDLSNGSVAAHFEYDAFGREIVSPVSTPAPFAFSTKYTDNETGLVYYGYRYFNPELGRWINRDPIEEEGGLNLYGFVGNGAVFNIDRLGLENIAVFVSHPTNDPSKFDYQRVVEVSQGLRQELLTHKACCGEHEIIIVAFADATADALRSILSGSYQNTPVDTVFAIMKAGSGVGPRKRRVRGQWIDEPGEVIYLYSGNHAERASETFKDVQVPTVLSGSYPDIVTSIFPECPNIKAVTYNKIAKNRLGMPTGWNEPYAPRFSHESADLLIAAIRQKVGELIHACDLKVKAESGSAEL